uniref:DUF4550 domain-containing protein n=2 Tax=Clastoptera arizonana TaxID=38151 RepID=A0A1B6DHJ0_9HEMI
MIEFKISFLLGFIFLHEHKNKKGFENKKTSRKQSEKGKTNSKTPIQEKVDPNIFECGNLKEICHVEYFLLPPENLPSYQIDIICWEKVAKIFTKESVCCVQSYIYKDVTWVAFSVLHKLPSIADETLINLLGQDLKFIFSQQSNDVMPHVKNDSSKKFFITPCENILIEEKSVFRPVSQIEPPLTVFDNVESKLERFDCFESIYNESLCILCELPCTLHERFIFEKIYNFKIQKVKMNNEREYSVQDAKNERKNNNKIKKVSSKSNKATDDKSKITLNLRADMFFEGGRILMTEGNNLSSTFAYAGIFLSVNNIMTFEQKKNLNPFTLNIKTLFNIPPQIIDKYGIQKVFCEFELDNFIWKNETTKVDYTNSKKIDFNHSHVVFMPLVDDTSSVDAINDAFLKYEAIQTGRLLIKVYATASSQEERIIPYVFGQLVTDPHISSHHTKVFHRTLVFNNYQNKDQILLGTAVFNLFPLTKGIVSYEDFCTLTSIPVSFGINIAESSTVNYISLHEEINKYDKTITGVIPEATLLEMLTMLQIRVTLASPLIHLSLSQIMSLPKVYSRVIVIYKDITAAAKVLYKIYSINSELLGLRKVSNFEHTEFNGLLNNETELKDVISYELKRLSISVSLRSTRTDSEPFHEKRRNHTHMITGFFLDNFNEGILVLEGLTTSTFPHIYAEIYNLPISSGRVIYNSNVLFSTRLYKDMALFGGIYLITMSVPIETLLLRPSTYVRGKVPPPTQQVTINSRKLFWIFQGVSYAKVKYEEFYCSFIINYNILQILPFDCN